MGHLSREREAFESLNEIKFCNVGVAVAAVGGAVVGGMMMNKGGGSAPDPNPGLIASADSSYAAAQLQKQTSDDYLSFYKQQYADMKPLMEKVYNSQIASQEANDARAAEYANYERNTYRPLEQSIVNQVREYNTDAKREQLARQASADVSQAFGSARGQQNRQLAAAGIRPDSGRFAALNQTLLTQEALARSGAANKSRIDAENLGFARSMDAASLGRNLASNASTAYGVALNAGNSAVDNMNKSTAMGGQGYTGAIQGYGAAANSYGTAGNIYGTDFNSRMSGYNAQLNADATKMAGYGQMAGTVGGFAIKKWGADGGSVPRGLQGYQSGGKVEGPGDGSGIDDQVPAMLSKGEYVLPADTVKAIGVKKLDKVVKKTHTPAAEQRKKKALKGKK